MYCEVKEVDGQVVITHHPTSLAECRDGRHSACRGWARNYADSLVNCDCPCHERLRMNDRQQAHVAHYLERLAYWRARRPSQSTPRLLAARDADEAHPLRTEEEAAEVVGHLRRVEREQAEAAVTAAASDDARGHRRQ